MVVAADAMAAVDRVVAVVAVDEGCPTLSWTQSELMLRLVPAARAPPRTSTCPTTPPPNRIATTRQTDRVTQAARAYLVVHLAALRSR